MQGGDYLGAVHRILGRYVQAWYSWFHFQLVHVRILECCSQAPVVPEAPASSGSTTSLLPPGLVLHSHLGACGPPATGSSHGSLQFSWWHELLASRVRGIVDWRLLDGCLELQARMTVERMLC